MGEHFRQQMGMRRLLEFLGEHEVPLQLAMPLYRKYGDRALEIIRATPICWWTGSWGWTFPQPTRWPCLWAWRGTTPSGWRRGCSSS